MKKYTELLEYISPFGKISIFIERNCIVRVRLGRFKKMPIRENRNNFISKALDVYFKNGDDSLIKEIPLVWNNLSEKHIKVLKYIRNRIRAGSTITYGELANIFKTSPRAIGQFMKKNPFPLFVPCHRVIGKKNLGGYSPDIRWKKALLGLEKQ